METLSNSGARSHARIAIIGLGCRYPGARGAAELWENILGRRQQFRRMPDVRLPMAEYQSDDRTAPDKTYGTRAAVIDGYSFDWAGRRIPKQTWESTDIAHWLALDVVMQMLDDAGYDPSRLPHDTTQVVVGNTLTGEFTRSNTLRSRWPFVQKMLAASASDLMLPAATVDALSAAMERSFKSVFAPINEDTLAGGLANTIAGRICNHLNVHGGGFVVDGACASSLIAVYTAATGLASFQSDFAIAGGVDVSLDPFELVGFAKTGALTSGEMSVYDKRGNGFIPGEGCGFVAMKRLDDALRDGDKVYAVLDGWGMSSDGKGGITAPNVQGQSVALQRAYRLAGIDPAEIDFIEGHGTGTTVGDRTELLGIARALGGSAAHARGCGVTSFKSIVGHTKAAAGVGAFIKAVMAVNQRVIPPTAGCEMPHDVFSNEASSLYPVLRGRIAKPEEGLRAGVSAMGFGGINLHVTLRSGPHTVPGLTPAVGERAAMVSQQKDEVYCLAAADLDAMKDALVRLEALATGASLAEMADLACAWNRSDAPALSWRACIVAGSPQELCRKARMLLDRLATPSTESAAWFDAENAVALGRPRGPARLGFVFPGQGSQRLGMARMLVERFAWAAELVAQADAWAAALGTSGLAAAIHADLDRQVTPGERAASLEGLQRTEIAQPAIVLCSLLWLKHLDRLGLAASCALGHSLGELTAFFAAGAFDEKTLIQLATLRGQMMVAGDGTAPGAMVSLACNRQRAQELIADTRGSETLVIANVNSESQTVVSGDAASVDALAEVAQSAQVQAHLLPVSNAFHSPLMSGAAEALRDRASLPDRPGRIDMALISSCDGSLVHAEVDLREHFASQIVRPVDFVAAARRLQAHCDLAVEVGPGGVLSNLLSRSNDADRLPALPVERNAESAQDMNWLLGMAHVHGIGIRWDAVYEGRIIKPFVPAADLQFIVNPCERPFERTTNVMPASPVLTPAVMSPHLQAVDGLEQYLARRGGFIADVIRADLAADGHPARSQLASGAGRPAPAAIVPATTASPETRGVRTAVTTATLDMRDVVVRLAAKATGFPVERISLTMNLLDDLNLDSIKVDALLVEACAIAEVSGKLDGMAVAGLSLGELGDRIAAMRTGSNEPSMPSEAHAPALQVLLDLVARYTGFPSDSLKASLSFVDDLNLDSIKLAALLSEASAKLGVEEGGLSPADLASESIEGLARRLDERKGRAPRPVATATPAPQPQVAHPGSDLGSAWVRRFEMRLAPAPVSHAVPDEVRFEGSVVAIQCEPEDRVIADAVAARLAAVGATSVHFDSEELLATPRRDIGHVVAILPRDPLTSLPSPAALQGAVRRLRAPAIASARQASPCSLVYLQFNGLSEGTLSARGDVRTACATAFAASIHLERPACRVRILDIDTALGANDVADRVLAELSVPGSHGLSHHDRQGRRHTLEARLIDVPPTPADAIDWNARDVILVTGGAKGITLECALAMAKASGARFALVGSSAYVSGMIVSSEISDALARFDDAGLSAAYFQCDIADREAVDALVADVERELGPITGVIHGAGLNKPRRVEQCSEADALAEIAPKLQGIVNLCAALDRKPPKLIAGLSSIIGITGMAGNAWYAFSNEALNLCLQHYRSGHPETRIVSMAYSVWADVGMGAKMGSTHHLEKMGISAIPLDQGVDHFLESVTHVSPAHQVVIASRLGGLDTWTCAGSAHPSEGRFLDNVVAFQPGVELVARPRLSLEDDFYLRDHRYRGVYLFPTVFGLEAMGQAVAAVLGRDVGNPLRLENIGLHRPIVVGSDTGARIQIAAVVQPRRTASEPWRVQAGIRTEHTGFRVDHFHATFVLDDAAAPSPLGDISVPPSSTDIDPESELYGGLLFQGPLFQRMKKIWRMDSAGSLIGIERTDEAVYFAEHHPKRLVLGDPACRDVLLQSAQLSEKGTYLPVAIDALQIHAPGRVDAGLTLAANRIVSRHDQDLVCDVSVFSEDGTPLEHLSGYRLKRMEYDDAAAAPEDYVDPQWRDAALVRKALDEASLSLRVSAPEHLLIFYPELSRMDRSRRRLSELPLFSEVILKAFPGNREFALDQLEIQWEEDGRPVLHGLGRDNVNVSLSHDRTHCLCVAGDGAQGCDIEPIVARSPELWAGLLGADRLGTWRELVDGGDSTDEAGTRLWSATESARKALGAGPLQLRVLRRAATSVLLSCRVGARELEILTAVCAVTRLPRKMIAMVVASAPREEPGPGDGSDDPRAQAATASQPATVHLGPEGQRKPSFRFVTTFKDTTTLRHSVEFPAYANWMGSIRELSVVDMARQLVPDFASGRWGMVTNESEVRMLADAHCLDVVEGRMHISRAYGKFNSSIDMHFEWVKVHADGSEQLLAVSTMAITWVEILGHGLVEVKPFPAYLERFVADHLPPGGAGGDRSMPSLPAADLEPTATRPTEHCLYEAPHAPKVEPELAQQTFATTLAESNLVGNIYFANYYHWQKRLIDRFFHDLSPALFTASGQVGEFRFRRTQVKHLREAMPFDEIQVVMALKVLRRDGITLHFDYYRVSVTGERTKLAHGECEAVWIRTDDAAPSDIPLAYRDALLGKVPVSA